MTTLEQRARDVVEVFESVPFAHEVRMDGETFREAIHCLKALLAERSAYVDIERIQLRNALSGRE